MIYSPEEYCKAVKYARQGNLPENPTYKEIKKADSERNMAILRLGGGCEIAGQVKIIDFLYNYDELIVEFPNKELYNVMGLDENDINHLKKGDMFYINGKIVSSYKKYNDKWIGGIRQNRKPGLWNGIWNILDKL